MSRFENRTWKTAQGKRLKDFEERKSDEIKNYFKTDGFDSEFVAVHPMADEDWWFEKFNENAEDYKQVDLYWKFDNDIAFVEIILAEVSEPELSARWRNNRLYLLSKVKDESICFKTVNNILKLFWEEHLRQNLFHKYFLRRKWHWIK